MIQGAGMDGSKSSWPPQDLSEGIMRIRILSFSDPALSCGDGPDRSGLTAEGGAARIRCAAE